MNRGSVMLCMVVLFLSFGLAGCSFDPAASSPDSSMESILRCEVIVRSMESALPWLQTGVRLIAYYWLTVLLPMGIFMRMHRLIATSLRISSLFIGGVCWWQSFIVTYRLLGVLALVTGTLLGGLGVVPMAVFATAARSDRQAFGQLMAALMLTLIARFAARFIANRSPKLNSAAARGYYAGDY